MIPKPDVIKSVLVYLCKTLGLRRRAEEYRGGPRSICSRATVVDHFLTERLAAVKSEQKRRLRARAGKLILSAKGFSASWHVKEFFFCFFLCYVRGEISVSKLYKQDRGG